VKVLVTGADGFVGRWVIRRLLSDGREVYGRRAAGPEPGAGPPAADLAPAEREAVRWLPLELLDCRLGAEGGGPALRRRAAPRRISSGTEATRDPATPGR